MLSCYCFSPYMVLGEVEVVGVGRFTMSEGKVESEERNQSLRTDNHRGLRTSDIVVRMVARKKWRRRMVKAVGEGG